MNGGIRMNLNILLIDMLSEKGILDTFRFIPKNEYNRVVIDRLADIHQDVRGNSDKDIGLNRIYNSDKCELVKTQCQLKDYYKNDDDNYVEFTFEHMYVPIGSGGGSAGIYNLVIPYGYRLTEIYLVDPFDKSSTKLREKREFRYDIVWDDVKNIQIVEMDLRSRRGSFSFIVNGKMTKLENKGFDFVDSRIVKDEVTFDSDLNSLSFDIEIKKSFMDNLKESTIFEPNFYGVGFNFKKFFGKK